MIISIFLAHEDVGSDLVFEEIEDFIKEVSSAQ